MNLLVFMIIIFNKRKVNIISLIKGNLISYYVKSLFYYFYVEKFNNLIKFLWLL